MSSVIHILFIIVADRSLLVCVALIILSWRIIPWLEAIREIWQLERLLIRLQLLPLELIGQAYVALVTVEFIVVPLCIA